MRLKRHQRIPATIAERMDIGQKTAERSSSIIKDKGQVRDQAQTEPHSKEAVAEAAEEEEAEAVQEEEETSKETVEVSNGSEPSHQATTIPYTKRCSIKTKMNQD